MLAVLVSGEGTTLEAIAQAIERRELRARIGLVVADRPGIGALARAGRLGLPTLVEARPGRDAAGWGRRVDRALREAGVELVVLAGFLSILPADWLASWSGRVVNLHPSLLPKFGGRGLYGARVHEAVLAAGERESGATVHLVTPQVDGGPILAQARVTVAPGDSPSSLRERIAPIERELLLSVLRDFADGRRALPYREAAPSAAIADGTGPSKSGPSGVER